MCPGEDETTLTCPNAIYRWAARGGKWTFQIGLHLWCEARRCDTCIGVLVAIHISRHLIFFFPQRSDIACSDVCIRYYPVLFSMCIFPSVTLRWSTSSSAAATGGGEKKKREWRFHLSFFWTHRSPPADQRFQLKQISFNSITLWNSLALEHRWNHASPADLDWEISSANLITGRLLLHASVCFF